jgi:hypothetical protein
VTTAAAPNRGGIHVASPQQRIRQEAPDQAADDQSNPDSHNTPDDHRYRHQPEHPQRQLPSTLDKG